jgi:hypothetical protein
MRAGEDLAQAQKEYDIAPAESKVAQEEYSNVGEIWLCLSNSRTGLCNVSLTFFDYVIYDNLVLQPQ